MGSEKVQAIRHERKQIRQELDHAEQRLDTGRAIFHRALDLLDNPQAMYQRGNEPVMVDLLVRYSNQEDELMRVVKVLGRIEDDDQQAEPGIRLPEPPPLRGLARLSPSEVRQLVASFRAGTPKHVLANSYRISLSTVKRLLRRRHGKN